MPNTPSRVSAWVLLVVMSAIFGSRPVAAATPATRLAPAWKPVSPQELALRAAIVEPDADAEAIFWDVRIEDSLELTGDPRTDTWNHVRVKVFTQRGKEAWTRVDVPYEGRTRIADLAARTIKPDGTIVEAGKDALSERVLVRAGGVKVKAQSVAVPGVEVGSLVDYRWREIRPDRVSWGTRLIVEREIPIQTATFAFRPIDSGDWQMETQTFGVEPSPFTRDKDGFSVTSVTSVRSVAEEPFAPPPDTYRAWILVTYGSLKDGRTPDEYWRSFGRRVAEYHKAALRPGGDVKAVAASVVGGETDPGKKLALLFEHCRAKIRNLDAPGSSLSREERDKLTKDESPSSTLSRQQGTSWAIDVAFTALANAAGLEARVVRAGDRDRFFFDPAITRSYFLGRLLAAVKVGEEWRFTSPGTPSVAFGELPWEVEDQNALLCDPKEPRFVPIPAAPAERSTLKRSARFRLDADGTLDGTATVARTGHAAHARREAFGSSTPGDVEKAIREEVTDRLASAEVSAPVEEGRDTPEKPLVTRYQVRVPGYASKAGSRLVLPVSWFRKGRPAPFPSAKRTQPVFVPYGYTEEDEVTIELPGRLAAEELTERNPIRVLGGKGELKVTLAQEGRTLTYRRSFRLAGGTYGVAEYASIKRAFDRIQSADELTITLAEGP